MPRDRRGAQSPADDVPQRPLLRREVPDVLGEEVDLHARMGAIGQHIALVAPVQWPIIRCDRHGRDHPRIDVVRKHAIEHEMVKRRFQPAGRINRRDDEIPQSTDSAIAIRARCGDDLVHAFPSLLFVNLGTARALHLSPQGRGKSQAPPIKQTRLTRSIPAIRSGVVPRECGASSNQCARD